VKYRNGFVMTIFDITPSKEAEEQLRRRETLLSQAETIAQLGSWEIDLLTGHIVMSDNMIRMFGINPKEFQGRTEDLIQFLHPEDRERSNIPMKLAIENHTDYFNEFRTELPDGTVRYFVATGRIIRDDKDRPLKCVGVTMDISSRVNVMGQLRRNEILYRTFASNMPDTAVILVNDKSEILLIDGNSNNPLLADKESFTGRNVHDLLVRYDISLDIKSMLAKGKDDKNINTAEIEGRYFRVHIVPVEGERGTAVSGMILFQDITEIRKAEMQLESRLVDLDRSNKELENFAYVASHDLQEPLRKISAFGDRLKSKYESVLPPDGADYIRRMTDATLRMQRLISDLLAFSRITRVAEPFQVINMSQVIREILGDIEMKIHNTGATIITDGLAEIEGIPSQMHQLFQNLLLNAIKFSRQGVAPLIKIHGEIVTARQVRKKGGGKYLRISVKDNGIGFDQQYSDRIFTLFQRLHGRHDYEGTGIGLAVCKKIVEFHNGTIEAFGVENEGAEFVVVLPLTQWVKEIPKSVNENADINTKVNSGI
jgi:PAS domain S-box-containing protein